MTGGKLCSHRIRDRTFENGIFALASLGRPREFVREDSRQIPNRDLQSLIQDPARPIATMTFFNTIIVMFGIASTIVYLLYRTIRPKPLPGIPSNPGSAGRLLGDLPEVLKLQRTDKDIFQLLGQWCHKLNSPIMQVFLRPGARPWVIVADPQEEYDIMTRRTAEFERSSFFADLFRAFVPSFQAGLATNDQCKH